jgi:hypothetical protein
VGGFFNEPTTVIFDDQAFVFSPSMKATSATPLILSSSARRVIAVSAASARPSKARLALVFAAAGGGLS